MLRTAESRNLAYRMHGRIFDRSSRRVVVGRRDRHRRAAAASEHSSRVRLRRVRERVVSWLRRYGLAELAGIATALAGSNLVFALTRNEIAAAYGAVLGENLGFYGLMVTRELRSDRRLARAQGQHYGTRGALRSAASLMLEFGPAEALDSIIIRPAAIGLGTLYLGRPWGVIAGKLAADVTFYIPVIVAYEMQRRIARARRND
jgi:hypothetical protein